MKSKYGWGVDGYGRAHICKEGDNVIIYSMINGNHALVGAWDLEEQEENEKRNTRSQG